MWFFGRPNPNSTFGELMLWSRTNLLAVFFMRLLQLLRFVGWIVSSLVSFVTVLVTDVLYPLGQRVWVFVMAFLHFYWALLLGTVVIEVVVFLPFFMSVVTYLIWLFWPTLSCVLEDGWPAARLGVDLLVSAASMGAEVINLGIRTFNMFVPVMGYFINFLAEIAVQWSKYVNLLLGESNINEMLTGIKEIMLQLSEISVNITEAFIAISPTILQAFSVTVGSVFSIILEVSPVLLELTSWMFRIMPFQVIPFSKFIGPVIRVVQSAFGLRSVLAPVLAFATTAASASVRTERTDQAGSTNDIWKIIGESAEPYWDPQSADRSAAQLESLGQWLLNHPLGSYTDYFIGSGIGLNNMAYYAGTSPRLKRGHVPSKEELPLNWRSEQEQYHHFSALPFYHADGPLSDNVLHFLNASERHSYYNSHTRLADKPLDTEFNTGRRQCRSRFCGGEGATVQHPLKTIGEERMQDLTPLHDMVPSDLRSHRKRYTTVASLLHATRKTIGYAAKHHNTHGHHLNRHVSNLVQYATGETSIGAGVESVLRRHPHPMDSVMSTMPVLSEFVPFKWILNMHHPDDQEAFYGVWASKRQFFLLNTTDEVTGESEMVMHVTLARREDSLTTAAIREHRKSVTENNRKRQFFAPGMMIPNTQPAPEEDVPPPPMYYVNPYSDVTIDIPPPPDLVLFPVGVGSVGALLGLYAAGRLIEPALPILRMLYTRDCVSWPRHPWCLPEIPAQVICMATTLVNFIPRDLPVRLCKYEKECSAVKFCIPDRPPFLQAGSFVRSLRYQFNLCWVQNMFVYVFVLIGFVFTPVRIGLDLASKIVPVVGFIFKMVHGWIPEPISLQQGVCLVVFSYAGWSLAWIIAGFLIILPLLQWAFTTAQGFLIMIEYVRGLEQEYYLNAMYTPGFELRQAMEAETENATHKNDFRVGYTHNALVRPTQDAIADEEAQAGQPMISASIEPQTRPVSDHERARIISDITNSIHKSITAVGSPVRGRNTTNDLIAFEKMFSMFILPPHYSSEFARRFINNSKHQSDKAATRTLPFVTGQSTHRVLKKPQ